jgi:hypothetical protein
MKNQEHQIQVAICNYLDWLQIPYFAIPNGSLRTKRTGALLKAEGVKAGVADLFIMQGNQLHHGLFIEVKTMTGKQQETQKNFEKIAFANHYCYEIVRSLDELIEKLNTYLKIK